MYDVVLVIHSWVRWVVLVMLVVVVARSVGSLMARRDWQPKDRRFVVILIVSTDVQLLLGLLLWGWLSPLTSAAFSDMKAGMKDAVIRFFTVEHSLMMVIAAVLIHVAGVLSRRRTGLAAHKAVLACVGVALLVVLMMIPWPFMAAARPLFRI